MEELKLLYYSDLSKDIKLKFYKHIESIFVDKYKSMGLLPFNELSKVHQEEYIRNEIDRNYVLLRAQGSIFLLKKENRSFLVL